MKIIMTAILIVFALVTSIISIRSEINADKEWCKENGGRFISSYMGGSCAIPNK